MNKEDGLITADDGWTYMRCAECGKALTAEYMAIKCGDLVGFVHARCREKYMRQRPGSRFVKNCRAWCAKFDG
jgi:hypothetical protein